MAVEITPMLLFLIASCFEAMGTITLGSMSITRGMNDARWPKDAAPGRDDTGIT